MKLDLSIVIVNYNSADELGRCLRSISEHQPKLKYEIIVVDNASPRPLTAAVISEPDNARLVKLKKNGGFGAGNNAGAKLAEGEFLLLLNPDTIITDDAIDKLFDFSQTHPEVGATTCLLYNQNGKKLQQYFFGRFQSILGLTLRRYNNQPIPKTGQFFFADIVTGAALIIKKDLYDQLDGFDERFFMYLEDDDLCRRLVDLGYRNAVLKTAKIIHLEGRSSDQKEKKKYYYKSQDLFWQKHNGRWATLLMKLLRWPYKIIRSV